MSSTIASVTPETLAMFRAGDEAAIERVYRENYRTLLDAATRELGDAARAARVVEHAAVDLWRARERLESAEALDQVLAAALHDRVIHEQSRMAARHRHSPLSNGRAPAAVTAPSADVSWEHVKALLHPASEKVLVALQTESRHITAGHLAAVGRQKRSLWPLLLAVIGAVGILALLFFTRSDDVGKALTSPEARTISAKAGQRGTFTLNDGTIASLGSVSSVTIPPGFPNRLRTIGLQGTASFTVASREGASFVVRAGGASITALGTTFDVAAFPDDPVTVIRVRQGGVKVSAGKEARTLNSGESISVERSGTMRPATPVEVNEGLAWIDGEIQIVDRPLREALPIVRRWYDIDMRAADDRLLDRRITTRIKLDSAGAAIHEVETLGHVKLVYERNAAVLRDAPSPAARK